MTLEDADKLIALEGSGGDKEGRKPVEDPESLRSRSSADIVAVLSEVEILGF